MKLITPSFEIIEQKDLFKHIELCGRVCYKSENNITETSSQKFIDNLIKSGHTSVLEHGTVYLDIRSNLGQACGVMPDNPTYWDNSENLSYEDELVLKYHRNPYSKVSYYFNKHDGYPGHTCITTNLRVIHENRRQPDLQYQCEPTEFHEKRVTVKFIMDRIGSQSFVRHRVFSFSQESTRYCNYSKDKFGNELTFISPFWCTDYDIENANIGKYNTVTQIYTDSLKVSEKAYLELLNNHWTPQQARAVLPNSLKTELIMTGFIKDWKHFFKLRCDESAHPQARELAIPLCEEFKKREYL